MLTTRRDVVTPLNASGFVVMGFAGRGSGGGRGVHDGDNIHPRNDNIAPCSLPVVFMYESPKWLLATGRLDQCRAALTGIMRINKVQAN